MLLGSGQIPPRSDYRYEVKWDGFRCLLSTENGVRTVSRRGSNMTELLPELASFRGLPAGSPNVCPSPDTGPLTSGWSAASSRCRTPLKAR